MTHEQLIWRMKSKLNLGCIKSTFISRQSILQYIQVLHEENQNMRQALNPPSASSTILEMQEKTQRMKGELSELQLEERLLEEEIERGEWEIEQAKKEMKKNNKAIKQNQRSFKDEKHEEKEAVQEDPEALEEFVGKFTQYFQRLGDE